MKTNDRVAYWGWTESGRVAPPYLRYQAVSPGANHACGIKLDGTMVCWGDNSHGQADPPAGTFSAGADFSCGLRDDGSAVCWGNLEKGLAIAYGPN